MSGNVLQEFFYLLGWKVDAASEGKAKRSVKDYEKAAVDAEKAVEAARIKGAKTHQDVERIKAEASARAAQANLKRAKEQQAAEAAAARASKERTSAFVKGAAAMVVAIEAAAVATTAAVVKIADGMEKLYYASERTNASVANLKAFSYAASQLGSTADGASNSLEALAQNMRSSPGYEGMIKNLGVATRQNGKLRDLTEITIDLGDALEKMPHFRAKAFGDALSIDERTLIAIKDGTFKKNVLEYREMLATAGLDADKAAKDSAVFMNIWRRMWAAVDILVSRIGGALTEKFGAQVERLTTYLLKNSDAIAKAIIRIAETLLRLATRVVDLVGAFTKLDPSTRNFVLQLAAVAGALLLLRSGPIAALLALAAGIVTLYDDYRRWQNGAKDTLIPWDKWWPAIQSTLGALKDLWEGFDKVAQSITGQSGLAVAFGVLATVLAVRVLAPLGKVVGLLGSLGMMRPPPWLLGLLGVGALAGVANSNGILDGGAGSSSWHERIVRGLDPGIADRVYGQTGANKAATADDNRTLLQRMLPTGMGGRQKAVTPNASQEKGARESYDFWRSKGVSHEGAAGLVGMEQGESQFNPNARGDGGKAHGAFQHHADRRAKIMKALGIDISNATHQQQLEGAHWEFQGGDKQAAKVWDQIKNSTNASQAAALGVGGFERPGNIPKESALRGGYAEGWAKRFGPTPEASSAPAGATDLSSKATYRNGQLDSVKGFVVHHTGGRGTPEGVVNTLNQRGLGVQYVMDREGRVFQTLPDGARGAHLKPAQNGSGLNNSNALGMEVIAKNDADINPKQVAAAIAFIGELKNKHPGLQVFGHGELNAHKQETEGKTIVDATRNGNGKQMMMAVDKVRQVAIDTAGKVEETLTAYPRAWMDQAQSGLEKGAGRTGSGSDWRAPSFSGTPLGVKAGDTKSTTNNYHEGARTISVSGVSDPKEAADHISKADTRRRSDLIGNFQNRYA